MATSEEKGITKRSLKTPLSRGKSVLKTEYDIRVSTGNIAAVDFGTTFCSLAYKTTGEDKVTAFRLSGVHNRVPNAMLLKKSHLSIDTTIMEVVQFGCRAQEEYSKLRPVDRPNFLYFERVKMLLEKDTDVNRELTVCDFAGNEHYLVEVIAFVLKHLKEQLLERLSMTAQPLKTTDFDWVITVPAIWQARGKQLMREAAYLACLLSDAPGIQCLTPIGQGVPRPDEGNFDKLSLALEPESAAIYCQNLSREDIADFCGAVIPLSPSQRYVVLDIGGGTIDVTAQRREGVTGKLDVLSVPTGNSCGGTIVNEEFSKLLQRILQDEGFNKFVNSSNPSDSARNKAVINQLLYKEFEDQKVAFGEKATCDQASATHSDDDEIKILLPGHLSRCYSEDDIKDGIAAVNEQGVDIVDDMLYVKYWKVKELFKPAMDGIIQSAVSLISDLGSQVDTVYLVGGFGGCRYVYHSIRAGLSYDINIIVPKEHKVAIASGAVIWRENPQLITSRRADATYGISVSKPYKEGIHDPHYCFINDEGEKRCNKVFEVYLEKGEIAHADRVFTNIITPSRQTRTNMTFDLYCTSDTGVQYVVDKNGHLTVRKIGHLSIDIPNPDNVARRERKVQLTWDFSSTEILVRACYLLTGLEVKCIADFLSSQSTM